MGIAQMTSRRAIYNEQSRIEFDQFRAVGRPKYLPISDLDNVYQVPRTASYSATFRIGSSQTGPNASIIRRMIQSESPKAAGRSPGVQHNHLSPTTSTSKSSVLDEAVAPDSFEDRKRVTGTVDLNSADEDTVAASQSSGVAGELWIDTLSLREWLQAHLTAQVRQASYTANLADSTFADM
jgi:hypothetical protein